MILEETKFRDANHGIRYLWQTARRTVRQRIGPDFGCWFNHAVGATNAALRVVLDLIALVLECLLEIVHQLHTKCQ